MGAEHHNDEIKNDREKIKKIVLEAIDKTKRWQYYISKTWRYPKHGDDANTNTFLKFMLENEYRSGILVFIPDSENLCKINDRDNSGD